MGQSKFQSGKIQISKSILSAKRDATCGRQALEQRHLTGLHLHHHDHLDKLNRTHRVHLWLSDVPSSHMDAIREGVSLKKVEDKGKFAVEATTPGMLQRALSRRLSACLAVAN